MLRAWLVEFAHDDKLVAALIAVALDFFLGVFAAIKMGTFRLSYVADFARNDLIFKLFPWMVFYILALVAGGVDIVIPGLDLGFIAGTIYAGIMVAWVASILDSLKELGFPGAKSLPMAIASKENAAPPKS